MRVCVWRRSGDARWQSGSIAYPSGKVDVDPDGADWLFQELDGKPETYRDFAREYYEREIDTEPIKHIYDHRPLTQDVVAALNPDATMADVSAELVAIGYPDPG